MEATVQEKLKLLCLGWEKGIQMCAVKDHWAACGQEALVCMQDVGETSDRC